MTAKAAPAARQNLAVYLNDHLAGSVAAIALIDDLRGSAPPELCAALRSLRREIINDRRMLKDLIKLAGGGTSKIKALGAWLAEKISRLKLRTGDSKHGPVAVFESLEILSLGIEGKRLLWRVLDAAWPDEAERRRFDFGRLAERASQQRDEVERWRMVLGCEALLPSRASKPRVARKTARGRRPRAVPVLETGRLA